MKKIGWIAEKSGCGDWTSTSITSVITPSCMRRATISVERVWLSMYNEDMLRCSNECYAGQVLFHGDTYMLRL